MSAKLLIFIAVLAVATAAMVRRDVPASFAIEFLDSEELVNRQHQKAVLNEVRNTGARDYRTSSTSDVGTKKSSIAENINAADNAMVEY